jgi:signal transduction histidine kinase/CheY-like chemotaxis protein/HPt (histidine-containing phosphotransfer) domain-containing protein
VALYVFADKNYTVLMNFSARTALPLIILITLAGCSGRGPIPDFDASGYHSYRDIPFVSEEEIAAIEALRAENNTLIYGSILSKESFFSEDGEIKGYTSLFCNWLTEVFGITFEPRICSWDEMTAGLESFEIDFTDEIPHELRYREIYFMTNPIAGRIIKRISIKNDKGAASASRYRVPRYGFLENSPVQDMVLPYLEDAYTIITAKNHVQAYEMLKTDEIDVFFETEAVEAIFEFYDDVTVENFYPVIHIPVSLATRNPELAPVISVLEKYINSGGAHYLIDLYDAGSMEYMRYRLFNLLTTEELEYLTAHQNSDTGIATGTRHDSYPISFYNEEEQQWQGIAVDILREIETLTGMEFQIASTKTDEWFTMRKLLEEHEISIVDYFVQAPELESRFIWADVPYKRDHYAFISKLQYPDINFIEASYSRIGVISNSTFMTVLEEQFPGHPDTREYATFSDELNALDRGEIDLIMTSSDYLLMIANYQERPGYKINLLFDNTRDTAFCFNNNEVLLRSIVSKAQRFVDTGKIVDNWTHRVFDYRRALSRMQVPYLIGLSAALAAILILLFIMQIKSRQEGKRLEAVVYERTRELEIQTELAKSASAAKSRFLASMSHEIRTPMNAIMGFSDLMRTDNLDEIQTGYFIDIKKMAKSLLQIINDILDFSKIEAGRLELMPVHFYMRGLFDNICSMCQFTAMAKDLDFRHTFALDIPEVIYADEIRLRQVVTNIVNNAIKYTREGFVSLDARRDGDVMIITVTDTGIGIRQEDYSKLFETFQQLDSEKNRGIVGTGLGLSITKNLVEMMGGKITFESEYGKGSVFTVTLPMLSGDPDKITRQDTSGMVSAVKDVSVLVVDDNSINLTVAMGFLATHNIIPDTAAGGSEALEMLREKHYDLIFMDHMMPEMDGIEATAIIRKLEDPWFQKIPIIALTANAVTGARDTFLEAGMNDFISKPIDAAELNAMLLRWLPFDKVTVLNRGADSNDTEFEELLKELNKITDMDLTAGLSHVADSKAVYIKILRQFCKELEGYLDDIKTFRDTENWKEYAVKLHAMKGIFANMGVSSLSRWASQLEAAAKTGDYEKCIQQTDLICESMANFREILLQTSLMDAGEAAPKHQVDADYLYKILDALDEVCKTGESGKADDLADDLKTATFSEAADYIIAEIRDDVASLDFDKVLEKTASLRAVIG